MIKAFGTVMSAYREEVNFVVAWQQIILFWNCEWVSVVSCTVNTLKKLKQILISWYKVHYIHYLRGMGQEASTFYKRLADMIAQKRKHIYSVVMGWLRCRLSFALIRSSVMCIRGSRSSHYRPVYMDSISLAAQEGHVPH